MSGYVYNAINKGIVRIIQIVVGTINADSYFAGNNALYSIVKVFPEQNTSVLYGVLDYVDPNKKAICKQCSGKYSKGIFNWWWMTSHPTFFARKVYSKNQAFTNLTMEVQVILS